MLDWSSGCLRADGAQLEYACWGPPPDKALTYVLLHEGLGCVALWRDFPERLSAATGCGVFAYSRRGYGRSEADDLPRPLDYMTREALDVLPQVLDALDAPQIALLGHSDGATIAAIYAGSVRDVRVNHVTLIAPHFFTEATGLASIAAARAAFETGNMAARMGKYHKDPEATFRGWADAWLDPGFRDWNVEDCIPGLACPVLAIQGDADAYGSLAQIDALDAAPFEVAKLILPGIGHAPHLEAQDVVIEALLGSQNMQ